MLKYFKQNLIPIIVSFIYLMSVFIVSPWGNYPVGDDIYHYIQIKLFQTGDYFRNGQVGPSIILQIFLGLVWSSIFGLSFTSLKILSVITTVITVFVIYKILKLLNTPKTLNFVLTLLIIFNPKIFYLSLTFNTEPYFLLLFLTSLYYLLKFNHSKYFRSLFLAAIFGGLSVLIRQNGILLLICFLFTVYLNKDFILKRQNLVLTFLSLLLFISISLVGFFWPRYYSEFRDNSQSPFGIISIQDSINKTLSLWQEIPYLALYLTPFIFLLLKNISLKFRIYSILLGLLVGYIIYNNNIFGIGNILYIEGLGARSYQNIRFHLMNNIPYKILFSGLLGINFVTLIFFISRYYKSFKLDNNFYLLLFSSFLFLVSLIFSQQLYDRYFIYFEVTFIFLFSYFISSLKLDLNTKIITFLYVLITLIYSIDFFQDTSIKWAMADSLSQKQNLNPQNIYFQDNYMRLNYILDNKDLKGLGPTKPLIGYFSCFIVDDIDNESNKLKDSIELFNRAFIKFGLLKEVSIEDFGHTKRLIKRCSDCEIIEKKYYDSPLYDIIGVKKYIKSYCLKDGYYIISL